jgi:hypothetical protein
VFARAKSTFHPAYLSLSYLLRRTGSLKGFRGCCASSAVAQKPQALGGRGGRRRCRFGRGLLVMMRRLVVMGRGLRARARSRRRGALGIDAGLSDKAKERSYKHNVFCHNDFGLFLIRSRFGNHCFLAEAWPTTALLRASSTNRSTLQTLRSGQETACTWDVQSGGSQ